MTTKKRFPPIYPTFLSGKVCLETGLLRESSNRTEDLRSVFLFLINWARAHGNGIISADELLVCYRDLTCMIMRQENPEDFDD